jgi:hypothetical protein
VYMSSARLFSFALEDCGPNSLMSKFDFIDAFKIVPAKVTDFRLQGFFWLNKFFFETRQIFGAKTSVPNFDVLANTVTTLVANDLEIQKKYIHRTLDDIPVVAPACKNWCPVFSSEIINTCENLNIPLAVDCPKNEKAFVNQQYGKVLGIFFDSKNCQWKLPEEKHIKYLNYVLKAIHAKDLSLLEFQKLLGILNNICLMAPFLRGFKFNLNQHLRFLLSNEDARIVLNVNSYYDLCVWANYLLEGPVWRSIAPKYHFPPLSAYTVITDASGKYSEINSGCGHISLDFNDMICFAHQFAWPSKDFLVFKDEKGSKFSNKTCCLEFIGILLPFLLRPDLLAGRYVIVKVDNCACFFGWINRQVSNDECASIMIRSLHIISSYLSSIVHIEHLPRLSTPDAELVDCEQLPGHVQIACGLVRMACGSGR